MMAVRMFKIAVTPDSTIQETSLEDLMFSSRGMIDASIYVQGQQWRRDLHGFIRTHSYGSLIHMFTGESVAWNLDSYGVFDVVEPQVQEGSSPLCTVLALLQPFRHWPGFLCFSIFFWVLFLSRRW